MDQTPPVRTLNKASSGIGAFNAERTAANSRDRREERDQDADDRQRRTDHPSPHAVTSDALLNTGSVQVVQPYDIEAANLRTVHAEHHARTGSDRRGPFRMSPGPRLAQARSAEPFTQVSGLDVTGNRPMASAERAVARQRR